LTQSVARLADEIHASSVHVARNMLKDGDVMLFVGASLTSSHPTPTNRMIPA
jgi:hypothetical protein